MPETTGTNPFATKVTTFMVEPTSTQPNARSSISCEVTAKGTLVLKPLDALGAYFLQHFAHGNLHPSWLYTGAKQDRNAPQETLISVELSSRTPPLISSGGDPFFCGMTVSPSEQEACRELVDKMREKKKPRRKKRA